MPPCAPHPPPALHAIACDSPPGNLLALPWTIPLIEESLDAWFILPMPLIAMGPSLPDRIPDIPPHIEQQPMACVEPWAMCLACMECMECEQP